MKKIIIVNILLLALISFADDWYTFVNSVGPKEITEIRLYPDEVRFKIANQQDKWDLRANVSQFGGSH